MFFPTPIITKLFLLSNAKTHCKHESSIALLGNYCSVSIQSSEAQQIPLELSAINVNKKKTVRERERERERDACVTLLIE